MKFKAYLGCIIATLTLLFASSALAEGLILSISDPELGSLVLKKDNPIDTGCPCNIGGLSIGEFNCPGERIKIQMYLGGPFPMRFVEPPGKYC